MVLWWVMHQDAVTYGTVVIVLLIREPLHQAAKWIGTEVAIATFPMMWKAWKSVKRGQDEAGVGVGQFL